MPRKKTKTSLNHVFEKVLTELRDEALAAKKMNQYYSFCKAAKSVRAYPFVLDVKLCKDLPGFGSYTFNKFQERLMDNYENVFNEENDGDWNVLGQGSPTTAYGNNWAAPTSTRRRRGTGARGGRTSTPRRQLNQKRQYSPKVGSGAYAILITMLREKERFNYRGFSTKQELIEKGSSLCKASMTTSTQVDFRRKYTAWHGVRTLQKHQLVFTISGRPEKFMLSDKGVELARKLMQKHQDPTYRFQTYSNNATPCSSTSSPFSPASRNYDSSSSEVWEDDLIDFDNISESDLAAFLNDSPSQHSVPGNSNNDSSNMQSSCYDEDGFCVITNVANNDSNMTVDTSDEQFDFVPDAMPELVSDEQLIFQSGDFEVYLIVDNAEAQDRSKRVTKSTPETIRELTGFGMDKKFEVRRLELGDFLWVARHKITGKELVLPYIIERKRMDDLAESIRDGRYHEQKFRLRKCGLPNVIYLVEKFGDDDTEFADLAPATLRQAIVNTQAADGFFIKRTSSHKNSMYYLATLTTLISCIFKDKLLVSCRRQELPYSYDIDVDMASLMTYEEFSSLSRKNKCLSVRDLFTKQLLQMKSMSVQKACAIAQKYGTVRRLRSAFQCVEPELLISRLTLEDSNNDGPGTSENSNRKQPVGPAVSKAIFRLFTDRSLQ